MTKAQINHIHYFLMFNRLAWTCIFTITFISAKIWFKFFFAVPKLPFKFSIDHELTRLLSIVTIPILEVHPRLESGVPLILHFDQVWGTSGPASVTEPPVTEAELPFPLVFRTPSL